MGKEKYFQILGIEPTTDLNVIKKAYRLQALKYHPDVNSSTSAHYKFIEITEAYEMLTGQRKIRVSSGANYRSRSKEEVLAEKVARAKARWKKQQEDEEKKDREYFQLIAFGWKWRIFQLFAFYTGVFSILLSCDYFLEGEEVSYTHLNKNVSLDFYGRTVVVEGEYFIVNNDQFWFDASGKLPIRANYGYLFHDLKSISILLTPPPPAKPNSHSEARMRKYAHFENKELYSTISFNSVYAAFPVLHIMFFVPILLILFKRPNLRFSIWRLVSVWIIFPTAVFFSLTNDRIFYFIDLLLEG